MIDNGYLAVKFTVGNVKIAKKRSNVIVILLSLKKNYSNVFVFLQFYSCITTAKIALTIL